MDGTIVDTSSVWESVNKLFLIKNNIFTDELLNKVNYLLHGIPVKHAVTQLKKICNLEVKSDELIINEFNNLIKENYEIEIKYIKEFEVFIKQLLKHNIPIAIATNSCNYGIEKVNNGVNLKQYFKNHIYGIACVENKAKPLPDIFLYAAKQLNINPNDCLVFEDSIHGVTAAKNAFMFTIAINTANIKHNLIHADKIIDCYSEIKLSDYFSINK
jgi:HAD superfamily hydrolase (TIGR01509 family)